MVDNFRLKAIGHLYPLRIRLTIRNKRCSTDGLRPLIDTL